MPSQIETRIEKLENSMGAGPGRVVVLFEDDGQPVPEAGTVIRVRFIEPEVRDDDQTTH
ncbi:hypothetical protein [Thiocystis violascens]|uniref:Uncharacterized protein n=1 Tax=Thiocystis violascens (strain ATCC 17096 / DSM 198 / 6111) TaxID=765911 RepID=I3Y999_THIV6|nr:hypothetical protein [Thiocystis violascens]AFL73567.1 hypothetical protein Thivi_1579 [Thiocystis violascens DSM 198]